MKQMVSWSSAPEWQEEAKMKAKNELLRVVGDNCKIEHTSIGPRKDFLLGVGWVGGYWSVENDGGNAQ